MCAYCSGHTAHVPEWTAPTEEKRVLSKQTEQRRLYDEYRTVDSALKNQLLAVFDYPYLSTPKKNYTGFATRSTMDLIKHLNDHYAHISMLDMVEKYERL